MAYHEILEAKKRGNLWRYMVDEESETALAYCPTTGECDFYGSQMEDGEQKLANFLTDCDEILAVSF